MPIAAAAILLTGIAAVIVFYVASRPVRLEAAALSGIDEGDAARGERLFWAGGCASCHAGEGAQGDDRFRLGGGLSLRTPFGVFYAPNISPDEGNGIGGWSGADFANAMMRGVAPDGTHYYPAFPYTSYARMKVADIADLWAFLQTLPAVETGNRPHELGLPYRMRRGLGIWKRLYLSPEPVVAIDESDSRLALGRYLVEGPAHCGECHTGRDFLGGPDYDGWLAGGPAPEGDGRIPNITPHPQGISGWTQSDIAYSLASGFTPEFDAFGGSMVEVQKSMAMLSDADREAIAAYLKAVPAASSR
jgi:mono/diheme cytochrome c family protein